MENGSLPDFTYLYESKGGCEKYSIIKIWNFTPLHKNSFDSNGVLVSGSTPLKFFSALISFDNLKILDKGNASEQQPAKNSKGSKMERTYFLPHSRAIYMHML